MEWLLAHEHQLSALQSIFASVGTVVAVLIFASGLGQYRRAEAWKVIEFLANLYRDFSDDPECRHAMAMLDSGERKINFGSAEKPKVVAFDSRQLGDYLNSGQNEADFLVRDSFDRFFIYLERFERAIRSKLVRQSDVEPYFGYWLNLLNGKGGLSDDELRSVLKYIDDAGFDDVQNFLARHWSN